MKNKVSTIEIENSYLKSKITALEARIDTLNQTIVEKDDELDRSEDAKVKLMT